MPTPTPPSALGSLVTFIKMPNQKATSELRLTNQTAKYLVFKVKSNAADLFTIQPSASGIVKPYSFTPIKVNLAAKADVTKEYKLLVQSIHVDARDINVQQEPAVIWKQEVLKRKIHSAFLPVKIEVGNPDVDPVSTHDVKEQRIWDSTRTDIHGVTLPYEKDGVRLPGQPTIRPTVKAEESNLWTIVVALFILFLIYRLFFAKP